MSPASDYGRPERSINGDCTSKIVTVSMLLSLKLNAAGVLCTG